VEENVTKLLEDWSDSGDQAALDRLFPIVYTELKRIAINRLKSESDNHTLQPTELAHEAYMKLVDIKAAGFQSRTQFFGLASKMMRNILVDHAKSKNALKRGGENEKVSLEKTIVSVSEMNLDIVALDQAMKNLAKMDETKSQIVELKFFGGLTTKEIAEIIGKSVATVEREWAFSRAWLHQKLKTEP